MAAATKSLSFAITASTTYENPYATARRFSTLDHLTNGRVGWNVVTSYLESAAKAFGLSEQIPHDERYERADEYLEVVYKLLEGSWKDDSRIKDAVSGKYRLVILCCRMIRWDYNLLSSTSTGLSLIFS